MNGRYRQPHRQPGTTKHGGTSHQREASKTHNQTSPPPSQLPNFGHSFISALRPLLVPDPANSNVPTGRQFKKQAVQVRVLCPMSYGRLLPVAQARDERRRYAEP